MSKIIDNTLVMSQEETYNEIVKYLSENQTPFIDKKLLKEQIDNVINEELGIADETTNLENIIEQKLADYISKGVYEDNFSVETELSNLNVSFVFKNFDDENEANLWLANERGYDGYSYRDNTIYLSIVGIKGDINFNDLADTIQHECTHYWEMKNMQKDLYNSDYQDVVNGIRNKNPYVSLTYSVIYYSNKNEINAFVNGSFASAMKKKAKYNGYKEFIKDNSISDVYSELYKALKMIKSVDIENDIFFESAAMRIGCDKYYLADFIKSAAEIGMKYLLKQVGKAYSLYVDKMKNGDV